MGLYDVIESQSANQKTAGLNHPTDKSAINDITDVCVSDVDECADPLQCPGQECVNTPGSYRCVSCPPGHGLLNNVCRGTKIYYNNNYFNLNSSMKTSS